MQLIADTVYKKQDYTKNLLHKGEYDNCTFIDCQFENANLTGVVFSDCSFEGCNMGNAHIGGTAFKNVEFSNCKLLGLNFGGCDSFLFQVNFEGCHLQLASFYKLKLKGTRFIHCGLQDVDFVEADLTNALFSECDLAKAVFENTILEKADFRTAINYALDPELNRLKKARFGKDGIAGLLMKYNIDIS